jgi:hypothetical protein
VDRAKAFDITLAAVRVVLGFYAIIGGLAVAGFVATAAHPLLGAVAATIYAWCVWQVFRGLYVD